MTVRITAAVWVAMGLLGSTACAVEGNDEIVGTGEELTYVHCNPRDAAACGRGEICMGFDRDESPEPAAYLCSSGDRCSRLTECETGYVCVDSHCARVERDADPAVCPRGSVPGITACAAGYESVVVSREPFCSACAPTDETRRALAERARRARMDEIDEREAARRRRSVTRRADDDDSRRRRLAAATGGEMRDPGEEPREPAEEPTREPSREADRCASAGVEARGDCRAILGYAWNGRTCVAIQGCEAATDRLHRSAEACLEAYAGCSDAPTR